MRKFLLIAAATAGMLNATMAQAVDVGDIYFSDKTFASSLQDGKTPIGLVYWVSPGKDFGYIMSLEQPDDMNFFNANVYCNEYFTTGTKAGDWWLPKRIEIMRMGVEKWNGVSSDKYTLMNNKLAAIKVGSDVIGKALKASSYYWSNSYSGYAFQLNTGNWTTKGGSTSADSQTNGTTASLRCVTAF